MPSCYLCCCVRAVRENFFGSSQGAELTIQLDDQESRDSVEEEVKVEGSVTSSVRHFVYLDSEPITGKVAIALRKPGSKLDHLGIKAELIGQIELQGVNEGQEGRTNHHKHQWHGPPPHRFLFASRDICEPGELTRNCTLSFELNDIKKPYESYRGIHARVRYILRVLIVRRLNGTIIAEQEVVIRVPSQLPEVTRNVKTEIGIADQIHIEMECNKWKYHLSDVISGNINFLLVAADISGVQLEILQRETVGSGSTAVTENRVISSYEILDGTPKTGDSLPIRLYLSSCSLTPTMRNVEERFTVKYYLNLVIVDEEGNKYFKPQEVTLYRRDERAAARNAAMTATCAVSQWKRQKKSAPIQVKHTSVKVTFQNDSSPTT